MDEISRNKKRLHEILCFSTSNECIRAHWELMKALKDGADPNGQDTHMHHIDFTPLEVLDEQTFYEDITPKMIRLLLEHGADPYPRLAQMQRATVSCIIEHIEDMERQGRVVRGQDGSNPLHALCYNSPLGLANLWQQAQLADSDPPFPIQWVHEARSSDGATPLHALGLPGSYLDCRLATEDNPFDTSSGLGLWLVIAKLAEVRAREAFSHDHQGKHEIAYLADLSTRPCFPLVEDAADIWGMLRARYESDELQVDTPALTISPKPRL